MTDDICQLIVIQMSDKKLTCVSKEKINGSNYYQTATATD